jgi:NTE family protein
MIHDCILLVAKDSLQNSDKDYESVLILQGGGSLGAYECGVYKALQKRNIHFDIIAGTSIGAINAAVISASKDSNAAKCLEDFWHSLAEKITPPFLPSPYREYWAFFTSALWGNSRMFKPLCFWPNFFSFGWFCPALYDLEPLKESLAAHVDFDSLYDDGRPRLIVTCTDIQNGSATVFDSKKEKITPDHILASAGYPFYGISWTKIGQQYLWDGTLLSNTPLREIIDASPKRDKKVYIVNLFPKRHDELPTNMMETWHRARDIMHIDKTDHNVRMSKIITRYLTIIKEMHDILEESVLDQTEKGRFERLEREYHKLACERGAVIRDIVRIERKEDKHFLFEDTDFSEATINELISTGENDANKVLDGKPLVENFVLGEPQPRVTSMFV